MAHRSIALLLVICVVALLPLGIAYCGPAEDLPDTEIRDLPTTGPDVASGRPRDGDDRRSRIDSTDEPTSRPNEDTEKSGVRVTGTVVDTRGNAVPGLRLSIRGRPSIVAVSRPDGSFEFAQRLEPGRILIGLNDRLWNVRSGDVLNLLPEEREGRVTLVVARVPAVSGRIVTVSGAPAAGYRITHHPPLDGSRRHTKADQKGEFVLRAPSSVRESFNSGMSLAKLGSAVTIVPDHCGRFGLFDQPVKTTWGTKDLVIVVKHAETVNLSVVEQQSQAPVARFRVFVMSEKHPGLCGGGGLNVPAKIVEDKTGRVSLLSLPGPTYLSVFPDTNGLLPSVVKVNVVEGGGPREVRVSLKSATVVKLNVTSEGGTVKGAKVSSIVQPWPDRSQGRPRDAQYPKYQDVDGFPRPEIRMTGIVDNDTTDEMGRAEVTAPRPAETSLEIHVLAEGHVPSVLRFPPGAELPRKPVECRLDKTSSVEVRLHPASIWKSRPALKVRPVHLNSGVDSVLVDRSKLWVPEPGKEVLVVGGLAPGRYTFDLWVATFPDHRTPAKRGILTCEVKKGRNKPVDVDVSGVVPVKMTGLAFVDGQPAKKVKLHWRTKGAVSHGWIGEVFVARDGSFEFPVVPRRAVGLTIPLGSIPLVADWKGHPAGGKDVHVNISLQTRDARFVVHDKSNKPLPEGVLLWLSCEHEPLVRSHTKTGKGGLVRLSKVSANHRVIAEVMRGPFAGQKAREATIGDGTLTLK